MVGWFVGVAGLFVGWVGLLVGAGDVTGCSIAILPFEPSKPTIFE